MDFPGKVACTLFVDKCNFRCPFCQNPDLVLERAEHTISEIEILEFLENRQGLLEGICITGGEPLLHASQLLEFLPKVKALGYAIKIDTNGSLPEELEKIIESGCVDYIAMDIKAPLEKYEKACGVKANTEALKESIQLIMESNISYEFRTTVVPGIVETEDIEKIAQLIEGAEAYYLQQFVNDVPLLSPTMQGVKPYSKEILANMAKIASKYVKRVGVRA